MKDYIIKDPWKIIEEGFDPHLNMVSESLFSLGNGKMGLRGNFEEDYSGETLQGTYNAGVYYPDKTRVGWWKNGYPEYFAKVLNSCNWIGLRLVIGETGLDLHTATIHSFRRELDMAHGILRRTFECTLDNGARLSVSAERMISMDDDEAACLQYSVRVDNFNGPVQVTSYLDFDVVNQDSNYDEKFWNPVADSCIDHYTCLCAETKKTRFRVGVCSATHVHHNNENVLAERPQSQEKYAESQFISSVKSGDQITIHKYCSVLSSLYYDPSEIASKAASHVRQLEITGYPNLRDKHARAWQGIWKTSDIVIKGDVAAQQGIRFNIFHLKQTYTGKDDRLNIGPKGFTGEKYGGSTYWDTEAYCLPFYLSTADEKVAKNLLIYRYKHLQKAIENAAMLGFKNGAALYPMVTINGEECHNEWEITFEEIHRNGAIAYAIHDFINYTGDASYLKEGGAEVLIGIARFWAQRVNYSEDKKQFVMLGVTGPNEYENNINNNWYTNYIARWCLIYTSSVLNTLQEEDAHYYDALTGKTSLAPGEIADWKHKAENMYFPYDPNRLVFLQQDGFLDKEMLSVDDIPRNERPINQNWSWDRILRSVYIKQADVLQGMYFFEGDFSHEELRRNFDFYEPKTVHESSLSPCVHNILACTLGRKEKAYEMYLRTARLDLDDYNNDTEDGLHITSMAGTWMSIVKGFGGLRVKDGALHIRPLLPDQFEEVDFKILFRGTRLNVKLRHDKTVIVRESGDLDHVIVNGKKQELV